MAYSNNPYLPKVRQNAVKLVYRGWGVRQVARYIGVHASTISKWLKKDRWYGAIPIPTLSSRPHHFPRAIPEEIKESILIGVLSL